MSIAPQSCDGPANLAMKVLITTGHREMLRWLARRQRRTMNAVIRVAIERVYEVERAAEIRSRGVAQGHGNATGRS